MSGVTQKKTKLGYKKDILNIANMILDLIFAA